MKTVLARYEVGIGDTSLEHFRLWGDASVRAVALGGYVYDRMARKGKPQLWQAVNGDLVVQSVRLQADMACACSLDEFGVYQMPALADSTCPTCRKPYR